MQRPALAVAKHPGKLEDAPLPGRQEFLAGEFRRRAQMERHARAVGGHQLGGEGMEMGLVARRSLQDRGFDLDEIPRLQVAAQACENAPPRLQEWLPVGVDIGHPPGRGLRHRDS